MNIGTLTVDSPDIAPGARIDDRFTAYHENDVPEIRVSGAPEGTVELALIVHDPDAPLPYGFTHWVRYGLSPSDGVVSAADGSHRDAPNDAGATGWFGPKPPGGHGDHHYYFWVYALDTRVEGEPGREEFLRRYAGNVLEQNRLVGRYSH
ncbi:YbhB/YbcL family Raf kinase inhibitor-like protein [Microbacterium sp. CJ88]|uniref:YbhB/YbcL family Raf kinase inhibitor-like protein n=1 Tax=Microbacterium sp. CJ88 TaxID=3445672 RepID=UPI003F65F944